MKAFLKTEQFQKMNVGFGLDEGLANPTDAMTVFYGERSSYCERNLLYLVLGLKSKRGRKG